MNTSHFHSLSEQLWKIHAVQGRQLVATSSLYTIIYICWPKRKVLYQTLPNSQSQSTAFKYFFTFWQALTWHHALYATTRKNNTKKHLQFSYFSWSLEHPLRTPKGGLQDSVILTEKGPISHDHHRHYSHCVYWSCCTHASRRHSRGVAQAQCGWGQEQTPQTCTGTSCSIPGADGKVRWS